GLGLAAEVADVDVQRVRHHAEVEAPHAREDEGPREHASGVAQEELEQLELDRRQLDRPASAADVARPRVEPQVGEAETLVTGPLLAAESFLEAGKRGGSRGNGAGGRSNDETRTQGKPIRCWSGTPPTLQQTRPNQHEFLRNRDKSFETLIH